VGAFVGAFGLPDSSRFKLRHVFGQNEKPPEFPKEYEGFY
jgi:hypothetical protein